MALSEPAANPLAPLQDLDEFRDEAAAFIVGSVEAGVHCPAFGAIMPPSLHERARAWQRRLHEAGFAGLHWPAEYGGRGLTPRHSAVWAEECARADVQPYINIQGIILAAEAIMRSGTDAQKSRFLPDTASGAYLWCQLFSEPDAGSDLAGLTASAVATGDGWIVDGQKVWCSNGQHAEYGILLARTDPVQRGSRGISFFLLDMGSEGVEVRPLRQMTGDEEFCEVFLSDVHLPTDALLGELDAGWRIANEVLLDERGSAGAAGLIRLERRLAAVAALGEGVDDPVRLDALADLLARGHALRATLSGRNGGAAAASAGKLMGTELEFDAAGMAVAMSGADGMLAGGPVERFLYSPGMKIAGGTSEIQRNIIGERVLGLPREPRS